MQGASAAVTTGALLRALENGDLLAECQVLCGEYRAALEPLSEEDREDFQWAHRGSRV